MTVNMALGLWIAFCFGALVVAVLSLHLMNLVVHGVIMAHEPDTIIDGSRHLRRNQFLLTVVWAVFSTVGLLAVFDSSADKTPPQTTIGVTATWLLVFGAATLAYKTTVDYWYTRSLWHKRTLDDAQLVSLPDESPVSPTTG